MKPWNNFTYLKRVPQHIVNPIYLAGAKYRGPKLLCLHQYLAFVENSCADVIYHLHKIVLIYRQETHEKFFFSP